MKVQCHELHRTLDNLEQYGDLDHNSYLAPGELAGGRHGRSTNLALGSLSRDVLRAAKAGMEVDSIGRDVVGGLLHSLADNCGWDRGDNVARTLHYARMSC